MMLLLMLKQFSIQQQKQETDESIQFDAQQFTCECRDDEYDQPKHAFSCERYAINLKSIALQSGPR